MRVLGLGRFMSAVVIFGWVFLVLLVVGYTLFGS